MRYRQDGYTESGAGVWNQEAGSAGSTYGAVTIGMGVEKKMQNDELEVHLGYKRVLAGIDPTYPVHWVDGADNGHTVRGGGLDKNLLVLGLHAEQKSGRRLASGRGCRARTGSFTAEYPGIGDPQEELVTVESLANRKNQQNMNRSVCWHSVHEIPRQISCPVISCTLYWCAVFCGMISSCQILNNGVIID